MMDEVNDEAEFEIEGPLWIQVHAMSGGIEVTVTRAQMSDNDEPIDSPFGMEDPRKLFSNDDEMFEDDEDPPEITDRTLAWKENVFVFKEFDDIIPLAYRLAEYIVETSLHTYENKYYLHITYEDESMDGVNKLNLHSIATEYGVTSQVTIHRLVEYGKEVMDADVFTKIRHYFGEK